MTELIGRATAAGWVVVEKVQFPPDHTGGHFSECFLVERQGAKAFMKLLDISNLSDFDELLSGLAAFSYETSLVTHTTERGLSRVVSLLDHGELEVDPGNPVALLRRVPYLIFERGSGDIRKTVDVSRSVTDSWRFCVLHRAAAGLLQLHQANIAHQDLKPSNVIHIDADRLKLADLGRSSMRGKAAPHDPLAVAGALSYAPFELSYSYFLPDWTQRRYATDVFHLGCLTVFVFTNCVLPSQVLARLEPAYRPEAWGDPYEGVLPHLKNALDTVLDEMSRDFPAQFREDLLSVVRDLCDPDPMKRGHRARTGAATGTSLWLQKFVSRFDLLYRRASVAVPKVGNV